MPDLADNPHRQLAAELHKERAQLQAAYSEARSLLCWCQGYLESLGNAYKFEVATERAEQINNWLNGRDALTGANK